MIKTIKSSSLFLLFTFLLVTAAHAEDHFLVLSGGDSPSGNHLSQYLQTKTLTNRLREMHGVDKVDVLFASGQRPDVAPTLADVHGNKIIDGIGVPFMIVGAIEKNNPATKVEVTNYFQNTAAIKTLAPSDTLFLLVSDHGMPNQDDPNRDNNCINLWNFEHEGNSFTTGDQNARCLSRSELQTLIGDNVQAGQTVFAMSQCYSGGFHKMSVTSDKQGYPQANPKVCGFTAITEDTIASGCTADVDGPGYRGYERYLTQQITGRDVVTGAVLSTPQPSLRAAHKAAALEDMTLDIPTSTSDFYLRQWAQLITAETFSSRTPVQNVADLKAMFKRIASLQISKDDLQSLPNVWAARARDRLANIKAMEGAISAHNNELGTLLQNSTLDSLNIALQKMEDDFNSLGAQSDEIDAKYQKTVFENIQKPWRDAVTLGSIVFPNPKVKDFEMKAFFNIEEKYGDKPGISYYLLNNIAINALSIFTLSDPSLASEVASYSAHREEDRLNWASKNSSSEIVQASLDAKKAQKDSEALSEKMEYLRETKGLLRRLILMRKELAALVSIGSMADQKAMEDYLGLETCESTAYGLKK